VGALGIVVGSLIIYATVMAIMRVVGAIARGEPVDLAARHKRYILILCALAAVTAYVKLRQKYGKKDEEELMCSMISSPDGDGSQFSTTDRTLIFASEGRPAILRSSSAASAGSDPS
jgi:hypothetical protein